MRETHGGEPWIVAERMRGRGQTQWRELTNTGWMVTTEQEGQVEPAAPPPPDVMGGVAMVVGRPLPMEALEASDQQVIQAFAALGVNEEGWEEVAQEVALSAQWGECMLVVLQHLLACMAFGKERDDEQEAWAAVATMVFLDDALWETMDLVDDEEEVYMQHEEDDWVRHNGRLVMGLYHAFNRGTFGKKPAGWLRSQKWPMSYILKMAQSMAHTISKTAG
jgi:hypothetical protein